jgi:hypothetical protein
MPQRWPYAELQERRDPAWVQSSMLSEEARDRRGLIHARRKCSAIAAGTRDVTGVGFDDRNSRRVAADRSLLEILVVASVFQAGRALLTDRSSYRCCSPGQVHLTERIKTIAVSPARYAIDPVVSSLASPNAIVIGIEPDPSCASQS